MVGVNPEWERAGLLTTLSSHLVDGFRHAGTYVAKSLLAPGPAISRSEQANKLAFVINLKTAKALAIAGRVSRLHGNAGYVWSRGRASFRIPHCARVGPFPSKRNRWRYR